MAYFVQGQRAADICVARYADAPQGSWRAARAGGRAARAGGRTLGGLGLSLASLAAALSLSLLIALPAGSVAGGLDASYLDFSTRNFSRRSTACFSYCHVENTFHL
jgi:hypothetical protein